MPARYAHWSPARNASLAPAVIAVAYWGYWAAIDSALANDSWSCDWTLAVICALLGSAAISVATAAA